MTYLKYLVDSNIQYILAAIIMILLIFMIVIVTQWAVAQESTKVLEYKGGIDYFHMQWLET